MPLIALTGGIASGKSTVAARFAELGAVVVDADAIAREVLAPGQPALAAVRHGFGDAVFREDGGLDRAALARIVFTDPAKRSMLNGIVHPSVLHRSQDAFRRAFAKDRTAIVVYDVPLIDARGTGEFDRVVVTEAPAETRVQRLVSQRGMTEEDARARVASQMSDADRRALATDLIDTSGTIEETARRAGEVWARFTR